MNQTVLFRILFLLFTGYSVLTAELLKPTMGGEEKEILKIAGKRRIYTIMRDDSLIYQVNGPARIELITRYPSPEKSKKSQPFSYQLVVDNEEPITINHRYKLHKSIRSVQHPSHYYTYSGNYFINIKDGDHTLSMFTNAEQKYPVLLRVIKKGFKTSLGKVNDLQPMVFQANRTVEVSGKDISYYELIHGRPLQLNLDGPKTLRILSRLLFDSEMGTEESFRIRVKSGKKVLGTYYLSTERSSDSRIKDQPDKVPGKWRTCEVTIPTGKHVISVEIVEKRRSVLARFQEYK
ncbi:MAG TPA: hypothetical protein DE027_08400 [Candidatus Marinimicrobia bacterium]|jgi:hypothetical protein|nr:hypothetical protein [Candidatus Neomarinimicrobiota bacterium]|tara:strand:+ start:2545 stop:3420 length:876 start_codon:yes stop_codon:yes gene_type:complete